MTLILTDAYAQRIPEDQFTRLRETGRHFGHPGEWQMKTNTDEDGDTLWALCDPISNVQMIALDEASLIIGWLELLKRHARPRSDRGWATLRAAILRRDAYTCQMCGQSRETGAALHVDHILPISLAGENHPDNLRTLCHTCNLARASNPFLEFVQ